MKYKLGQVVWYMGNGKIHSAPVLARKLVENLHPDFNSTKEQRSTFTPYGDGGILYATCHFDNIKEEEVFPDKLSLVNSLAVVEGK